MLFRCALMGLVIGWCSVGWGQDLLRGLVLPTDGSQPVTTLKYVEISKPTLIDPIHGGQTAIGQRIKGLVFRGLIARDTTGEWTADLVLDSLRLAMGDKTLSVRLRSGVTWPDGRPFTGKDVVFSYEAYTEPDNNYANRNIFEIFKSVELDPEDDSTVYFELVQSDPAAITRLGFSLMPEHIFDDTYIDPSLGFCVQPFGLGPYEVVPSNRNPDKYLNFAANPAFHQGMTSIDSVILQVGSDEKFHRVLLENNGGVQLDPIVRPKDIPLLDAFPATSLKTYYSNAWSGFALNCQRKFLRHPEVRQSFAYLFDIPRAFESAFSSEGSLISGPFAQQSFGNNPNVQPFPYDPKRGESLLDSLGLTDRDGDNVREDSSPAAEKMILKMVLSKQMTEDEKEVCIDFQRQVEKSKVKIEMVWLEEKAWYKRIYMEHDYDITFVSWKFDEASNIYPLFSSSQRGPNQLNIVQFSDARVDNLLEKFHWTVDKTEKKEVAQQLHALIAELCPYTFLWSLKHSAGYRNDRLLRWSVDPYNFFGTIHTWQYR